MRLSKKGGKHHTVTKFPINTPDNNIISQKKKSVGHYPVTFPIIIILFIDILRLVAQLN